MIDWLEGVLRGHPEVAFFLVLGVGYLAGKLRIGSFSLGAVTGTLLAGVLVGQFGVTISGEVKQCFFLLFLFSIGFRTGPQFFRGLRRDGVKQAALAAIVATVGLITVYVLAMVMDYDPGTAGGVVAGSLTESATIGTAVEAISRLDVPDALKASMTSNVAIAFAVTYLIGVVGAAWILAQLAPKLMGIDLAEECRKLESELQGHGTQLSARREFDYRAYTVEGGSPWIGRSILALEQSADGRRIFVERLRRNDQVMEPEGQTLLLEGDTIAVSGPRTTLVEVLEAPGRGLREVDDRELLEFAGELVDVVLTNKALDGLTLIELGRDPAVRGVFLKRMTRAGTAMGILAGQKIYRGDVLTIVGLTSRTTAAAKYIGFPDRETDVTDMVVVALGIVAGGMIGLPALEVAGIELGLSLPVGVLLGGLVCGWLRSMQPRVFGRIPGPTLWVFESIGLTGFVAVVGLNAGPDFVAGLQKSGLSLVLSGVITISVSMLAGILVGHKVFKMHPGVMLGVCAGGATATPALAAIQEAAKSSVPTMGYGVAYAVGNVLLALWGTVIVALIG